MNYTERKEIERCRDLAEMIWQSDGGEDVSSEIADLKDTLARLLATQPKIWDDRAGEPSSNAIARDALHRIDMRLVSLNCDSAQKRVVDTCRMIAQRALSSPPRNCDMPLIVDGPANNNADKAWLAFKHRNPDAYFDVPGLLRCIDWLFAPATEKKGGNNGR